MVRTLVSVTIGDYYTQTCTDGSSNSVAGSLRDIFAPFPAMPAPRTHPCMSREGLGEAHRFWKLVVTLEMAPGPSSPSTLTARWLRFLAIPHLVPPTVPALWVPWPALSVLDGGSTGGMVVPQMA